jgi:hypothetical protein
MEIQNKWYALYLHRSVDILNYSLNLLSQVQSFIDNSGHMMLMLLCRQVRQVLLLSRIIFLNYPMGTGGSFPGGKVVRE